MELLSSSSRSSEPVDTENFTGAAMLQRFLATDPSLPGRVYRVDFGPGTTTNWHIHDEVQLLIIIEGRCAVQVWNSDIVIAESGDVVRIEAREKHWHGATEDSPMTHFAINLGQSTEWSEEVSSLTGS